MRLLVSIGTFIITVSGLFLFSSLNSDNTEKYAQVDNFISQETAMGKSTTPMNSKIEASPKINATLISFAQTSSPTITTPPILSPAKTVTPSLIPHLISSPTQTKTPVPTLRPTSSSTPTPTQTIGPTPSPLPPPTLTPTPISISTPDPTPIITVAQIPKQADKININTASFNELDKITGVGPVIGQRIIDYRNANGPFQKIEDIKEVKGIGDVTFEKMRNEITVSN